MDIILLNRFLKCLIAMASIIAICFFCQKNAIASELNILLNSSVINLDPTSVPDQSSLFVSRHLNCQLFRQKNGYEIVPEAAKEAKTSANGKIIRIILKDNLHFVDGRPLTSKDVKDTFEYVMFKRPSFRNVPMWIDRIEIISAKEFNIILKRPIPMLFRAFSAPNFAIFSSDFISKIKNGAESWNHPIGCGEYKISEWKPHEYISLVPANNGSYPNLNFFFFSGDVNYLKDGFKKYDIVALYYPPDKMEGFKKARYYDPYILFASVNTELARWKDRDQRCGALSAIDTSAILTAFKDNEVIAADDIVPSGVLGYDKSSFFKMHFDDEKKVKYKKLKVMVLGMSVPPSKREAVRASFGLLSDDVELVALDSAAKFADEFRKSNSDFMVMGLKMAYGEAYEIQQIFTDKRVNPTGYVDERLINKIGESQFIADTRERAKKYQNISDEIKKLCLLRPVFQMTGRYALVKEDLNLPGFGETVLNEYFLGKAYRGKTEQ